MSSAGLIVLDLEYPASANLDAHGVDVIISLLGIFRGFQEGQQRITGLGSGGQLGQPAPASEGPSFQLEVGFRLAVCVISDSASPV